MILFDSKIIRICWQVIPDQVNLRDDQARSPLDIASALGRTEMVRELLARGAEVNAATVKGISLTSGRFCLIFVNTYHIAQFIIKIISSCAYYELLWNFERYGRPSENLEVWFQNTVLHTTYDFTYSRRLIERQCSTFVMLSCLSIF